MNQLYFDLASLHRFKHYITNNIIIYIFAQIYTDDRFLSETNINIEFLEYRKDDHSNLQRLKLLYMKILASRECKMRFDNTNSPFSAEISNESEIYFTSASGSACHVREYAFYIKLLILLMIELLYENR